MKTPAQCQHSYQLAPPTQRESEGCCSKCGARRLFFNIHPADETYLPRRSNNHLFNRGNRKRTR